MKIEILIYDLERVDLKSILEIKRTIENQLNIDLLIDSCNHASKLAKEKKVFISFVEIK